MEQTYAYRCWVTVRDRSSLDHRRRADPTVNSSGDRPLLAAEQFIVRVKSSLNPGAGRERPYRELLLRGGLPLLTAEPAVVRRVHERIEAGYELQLLAVEVLVARQLCAVTRRNL